MRILVTMNWDRVKIYRLKEGRKRRHRLSQSEKDARARNLKSRESAINALAAYVGK
jgi:hypothetical protein